MAQIENPGRPERERRPESHDHDGNAVPDEEDHNAGDDREGNGNLAQGACPPCIGGGGPENSLPGRLPAPAALLLRDLSPGCGCRRIRAAGGCSALRNRSAGWLRLGAGRATFFKLQGRSAHPPRQAVAARPVKAVCSASCLVSSNEVRMTWPPMPSSAARTLSAVILRIRRKRPAAPGSSACAASFMNLSLIPRSVSRPPIAPDAAPTAAPSSGLRKMRPN